MATSHALFPHEGPDSLRVVDRIPAEHWVDARIPQTHNPEVDKALHALEFRARPVKGDDPDEPPAIFTVLTLEDISPNPESDPALVFQHHEASGLREFKYEWTSRRIKLTKKEFKNAVQYTTALISHSLPRASGQPVRHLKPCNIQVKSSYQYLVLPYGSEFHEDELEEGEIPCDKRRHGEWKRKWALEEEIKVLNENGRSLVFEGILDALPQAARGIDRFWKADSVGEAFPILRAVETSEVIPYIATRDSFLPQNYEKMEWLGDFGLEIVAIDHAAMVYTWRYWDRDHFQYIKSRFTINHRLWKAGQHSRLERFFFAEPPREDRSQLLLPFEPEDLPGVCFATGTYEVRNKVWADLIESFVTLFIRKIGGRDIHGIKRLLQSLGVDFDLLHDIRINPTGVPIKVKPTDPFAIPDVRPLAFLADADRAETMQGHLAYFFSDLKALYLAFSIDDGTLTKEMMVKRHALEWIGLTIVHNHIAEWLFEHLPANSQEDTLTLAIQEYYATDDVLAEALACSQLGIWLRKLDQGVHWPKEDVVGLLYRLIGAIFSDSKRRINDQVTSVLHMLLDHPLYLVRFTAKPSSRRR